tara:strand:+ start:2092 stop:2289 length:198 start_codon:yes stop_codon:yes gene_type:complete
MAFHLINYLRQNGDFLVNDDFKKDLADWIEQMAKDQREMRIQMDVIEKRYIELNNTIQIQLKGDL